MTVLRRFAGVAVRPRSVGLGLSSGGRRTFASTSLKGYASRHGNDPDVLAKEKARNLAGTQHSSAPLPETAPGWNEHLATDGEAAVKADQSAPTGKPGKDLQDRTVAQTHRHHHTDEGHKGAEHHQAKHHAPRTGSEDAVKADRGEH